MLSAPAPAPAFRASGPSASVAPGGRGFKCPGGCEAFFDTAEESIAHGAQLCGVVANGRGGRVYDAAGKTCCLWDGCGSSFMASRMKRGKLVVGGAIHGKGQLLDHEQLHSRG